MPTLVSRLIRTGTGRKRFGLIGTVAGLGFFVSPIIWYVFLEERLMKLRGIDVEQKRKEKHIQTAMNGGIRMLRSFPHDQVLLKQQKILEENLERYIAEEEDLERKAALVLAKEKATEDLN